MCCALFTDAMEVLRFAAVTQAAVAAQQEAVAHDPMC
jgi:hypothetical protein